MGIGDYRRPADYQIENHYRCTLCGVETSSPSYYGAPEACHCGGTYRYSGESYPASSDDWDEERDSQDGEWRRR